MLKGQTLTLKSFPKVLVVEDDPDEALLVRWQLTEKPEEAFEVQLASSLAEVRQLAEDGYLPDVVLLDLNLPDTSGLETVTLCSQILGSVPLVVHTGHDNFALTEAAIEKGAQDYLIKGVDSWILRKSLRYALLRHERDAEDRLARSVFEHASEAILITDTQNRIIQTNQAFTRITGYSQKEALGKTPALLKSGHHNKDFYHKLWKHLKKEGHWQGEVWNRRKNGELFAEQLTINAVKDARGCTTQYVALFSDITLLKEEQRHLYHRANHDALTGLPNRSLFMDRIDQAFVAQRRHGGRLALVFIDLDGFKPVNDTYGHDAGDQVLQEVSRRILACVREEDTLARLGGDEFVLLLQHQDDVAATIRLLKRFLAEIARPYLWGDEHLRVSASLGVSLYEGEAGITPEKLMQQADEAMYQAKNSGKNDFCFYDSQKTRTARIQFEEEQALEQALHQNELLLHYQPVMDLASGRIIAVEALVRWQHPEKGLLLPEHFIEPLDDSDLLIRIQQWVLDNCLTQLQQWHQQGLQLPVSINLSASYLMDDDFPEHFYQQCKNSLPTANCLSLEVKEIDALDKPAATEKLQVLCERLDIGLVLDDFGAGYSSMLFLKNLEMSELKLNRDFVAGMLDNAGDLAAVEASIGLAVAFRAKLTAKGVETAEVCHLLARLGCQQVQGNYLCRPLAAQDLQIWLKQRPALQSCKQEFGFYRREDLPLVTAAVNHRAWLQQLKNYLTGKNQKLPALQVTECRFGQWWSAQSGALSELPEFQQLGQLHEEVHRLGEAALTAFQQKNTREVERLLHQLEDLRDQLLDRLEALVFINQRLSSPPVPKSREETEICP